MISSVNFGGLSTTSSKSQPLVAPLPEEYKQPAPNTTIKNPAPKPQ